MQALLIVIGVVIGVVLIGIMSFIGIYNGLVRRKNEYQNSFKQIDVQLKRRYDLIPNLVETAKKYLSHEKETLTAVISARNTAVSAHSAAMKSSADDSSMQELMASEAGLSGALSKLFALNESYPELKGDKAIADMMEELKSTENRISFARQHYNDSVTVYNNEVQIFPNNIISGMFHFSPAFLWEIENAVERENVKVDFD